MSIFAKIKIRTRYSDTFEVLFIVSGEILTEQQCWRQSNIGHDIWVSMDSNQEFAMRRKRKVYSVCDLR